LAFEHCDQLGLVRLAGGDKAIHNLELVSWQIGYGRISRKTKRENWNQM
jgi:hypothetical protein